jgi:putative membrane protein
MRIDLAERSISPMGRKRAVRMQVLKRIERWLLLGLVMAALVGACDDDDDDDGTNTNAQSESDASTSTGAGRGASAGTNAGAGRGGSSGALASSGSGGSGTAGRGASYGGNGGAGVGGTSGTGGQPAAGGASGNPSASRLTDAQIAAVTSTANSGEVDMGMLALERAQLPEVRDFAQMMVTMHSAAQQRAMGVLQALGVTPAPNPVSDRLKSDADAMLVQLRSTEASQFDLIYISGQVDVHMKVLQLIDDQLLPSATADALKADLTTARGEVQMHLQLATALMAQLEDSLDAGVGP